jgi:beta-1,2-xylosyltransferase
LREKPNTHGHLLVPSNYTGSHPITKLIQEAEAKAKAIEKKNKSIKYLRDAVADYETAFGVRPPRGFDEW